MKRYWVWRAVRMALFGLLAVAVASFVVMKRAFSTPALIRFFLLTFSTIASLVSLVPHEET